jgi:Flp pilus assembly protein TadD
MSVRSLLRFAPGLWLSLACSSLSLSLVACGGAAAQRREEQDAVQRESTAAELLRKAEASASVGDSTRAEQYYVSALKAGADARLVIPKLLVVCVADQRYPAAIEYAEQHLGRHPTDLDVEFAAASLHAAVGQRARARQLLESVLKARPSWPEAHYALASVLRADGDSLDVADEHDLAYLKLEPDGPFAERVRARLNRATP